MYEYVAWGRKNKVELERAKYTYNDNLAIKMIDYNEGYPEPYATMTVNLDEKLPEDMAYVDTNNLPDICGFIEVNGIGEFTGVMTESGFCIYPLYKFDLILLNE